MSSAMFKLEDQVGNIFNLIRMLLKDFVVPLFWTQTGYGLKPPPMLSTDRTHTQHLDALRRHFARTIPRYGPHVCLFPENTANAHVK